MHFVCFPLQKMLQGTVRLKKLLQWNGAACNTPKRRPRNGQPSANRRNAPRSQGLEISIARLMRWWTGLAQEGDSPPRPIDLGHPSGATYSPADFNEPFRAAAKKIKSKKTNDLVIFRFIERYQALFRPFFFASNLCHQTLKLNIFHSNWTLYETVERQPLINRLIWKQPFSEIVSSSYDLRHRILESTWLDHFIDSSCFIAFQSDEIRFFCSNALRTSFDWLILFSTL